MVLRNMGFLLCEGYDHRILHISRCRLPARFKARPVRQLHGFVWMADCPATFILSVRCRDSAGMTM